MKLSIGMMVKNESKHLRECLESLKPIRDAIESELIIVDTGSTDNTVEIAKEFTDKVYFHEWNSNFSEIRNTTIKYCTGEWFFCIDGDEVISNPNGILKFFNSNEIEKYKTASITIKNFTTSDNQEEFTIFTSVRIFKKDKDFRFEGAIHNQPIWKNPMIKLNSEILHYGYINNDKELMDKKFLRTSEILKSELEKDPENIYYIYQLSVSYAMHGDIQEALEIIKKAYNLVKAKKLNLNKYMYVSIFLSRMYLTTGKFKEVEVICLEATKKEGFYIDLYYYLAKAQFSIYKNQESIDTYNIYFKKIDDFNNFKVADDLAIVDYTIGNYDEACLDMAILHERLGKYEEALKFIEKIKSDRVLNYAFDISISLYAKLNKFEELRDFYYDIYTNHNIIKDYFISALELYLLNENIKTKENIFKVFSEGDTEYALLNKLRLNSDNVYDMLNKEINKLDFSNLPDYFGDILYYFLCKKVSLVEYLKNVNDFKIKNYCNYLVLRHKNLAMNLYDYLKSYKNTELNIDEIRIYKILAVYLLQDKNINNEKYSEILDRYLEIGEEYLTRIYNDDIIQGEFTNCMKDEDDMFLMYIHFANKNKNSEVLYVRYLRKALGACNYMKKGIDILSERLKENLKQKDNEMDLYKTKVKKNITDLIEGSSLEEAKILIDEYESIIKDDFEIYSMKAVVAIMENRLEDSKDILIAALDKFNDNFDLNYNLGYVYEKIGEFNFALKYYKQALENCKDEEMKLSIRNLMQEISNENNIISMENREKIVFFVKQGMDSFLGDIMNGLSDIYETKKIVVTDYKQIDEGMEWADICWFEWCDELIAYGSKLVLAKEKKIICRLHRYEALTEYPKNVQWENIDKLIIVTEHLKKLLLAQIPNIDNKVSIITIHNGVSLDKYEFKERKAGFNIAYIGYIHQRKNPVLLLQIINKLIKIDKRYKLYVAGQFQDYLVELYWNHQVKQMGLQNNVIFQGWQDNISKWLEDKNYILSTSIHESFGYGIAEAMARGVKPVIHNFIFAEEIWDKKYLFNDLDEAVNKITEDNYNSNEYYKYISDNFSLERQRNSIKNILRNIKNYDKKFLINDIKKRLKNELSFEKIENLTLFIPTYNRANILISDLENGFKLGNQNKIIVDDFSDSINRNILHKYDEQNRFGIDKIIYHERNRGVAQTYKTGISSIKTKFTIFSGDDDIIFSYNDEQLKNDIGKLNLNYEIVVPRYVFNLYENGEVSLGYDRMSFNNIENKELLKYIFLKGEMQAFNAGAVFKTNDILTSLPDEIFKVSEDYILLSRILSKNLNKKIFISEDYLYVRRKAKNTLSGSFDNKKLSIHLISMIISGYYCMKNKLISKEECLNSIKNRGKLLEEIYEYGAEFSAVIIEYITGEISINEFIQLLNKNYEMEILTTNDLPNEVIKIQSEFTR